MENIKSLKCISCGREYPSNSSILTCPDCGQNGILDVIYDYDYIKRNVSRKIFYCNPDHSIWRYSSFLPVLKDSPRTPLKVGWTPFYKARNLAKTLGVNHLFIKDDGLNPTASLKDRASAIAVVKAREEGYETVACSSTGNAASSLAGNAAAMGLKRVIFVPQRAPQGKVAQLLIFGATVIIVQGDYEDTFRLSAEAIDYWGWYNRNAAINPYLVEGKKTVTMEICEQLDWQVPDWAIFSVGDGCTIAGAWKGFKDLYQVGLIDRLPKMIGVQAEGCCPITKAFHGGSLEPMEENTIADSIAVGVPRNPQKALNAIKESKGTMINVTDEEILEAMKLLGNTCGIFGEPAGVTGLAGLKKLISLGMIDRNDRIVTCITGNGLKDIQNAIKAAGEPIKVNPDITELKMKLSGLIKGKSKEF
ncbi:MAG: threonine synthase [Dehalobacterium sp.]